MTKNILTHKQSVQHKFAGRNMLQLDIVFVWSQHDEGNVEQRRMAKVPSKTL